MNKLRFNNWFTAAMLLMISLMVTSCMKFDGEDDGEKMIENETAIINYLAENNMNGVKDTTGLYYLITDPRPTGKMPAVGDEVQMIFKMSLLNGTVVDSSGSTSPAKIPYGLNFYMPGMARAIGMMRVGEQGSFFLPFYLAYGRTGTTKVPAYSPVRLDIRLVNSRSEETQIVEYLNDNALEVSESGENGLRIIRLNEVEGDPVGVNKSVKVKYKLWALSDKSKTIDSGDLQFYTNSSTMISGFDKGVQKLKVGEKAILIFPSQLGYGKEGRSNFDNVYTVLPYASLAFEVEVLQIN